MVASTLSGVTRTGRFGGTTETHESGEDLREEHRDGTGVGGGWEPRRSRTRVQVGERVDAEDGQ